MDQNKLFQLFFVRFLYREQKKIVSSIFELCNLDILVILGSEFEPSVCYFRCPFVVAKRIIEIRTCPIIQT